MHGANNYPLFKAQLEPQILNCRTARPTENTLQFSQPILNAFSSISLISSFTSPEQIRLQEDKLGQTLFDY